MQYDIIMIFCQWYHWYHDTVILVFVLVLWCSIQKVVYYNHNWMQIIKSLKNNIFIAHKWTMTPHCHSSVHTSNIWCAIAILFCENVRSELKSSSVFLFFLFLSPPGFCHSYPPSWKDESSHHQPLLPLLLDSASLLTSFLTLLSHMSPSLPPSLWGADQFTASLQGVTTPHPCIPSVLTLNTFWWGVGWGGAGKRWSSKRVKPLEHLKQKLQWQML